METMQKENNIFLSVVIPVYRAENICERMAKEFEKIPGKCEAILVEDCGPDKS
ncbi:MAG: hypothetical protein KAS17_10090 [Victivallaceae bacterium]|nr:hypothetical protein [Victivallaceae bacterium]